MPGYTLDTNVIIYYAWDDQQAIKMLRPLLGREASFYVPTVVVAELFSVALAQSECVAIETMLGAAQLIPLYENIARSAGDLRQRFRIKLPDAIIAATAVATHSILLTRNTRDFVRIPVLVVKTI